MKLSSKFSGLMAGTKFLLLFAALSTLQSCASYDKIPYFKDYSTTEITKNAITNFGDFTVQAGDRLSISVSSINPEAAVVFNQNSSANPDNPAFGYVVDKSGNINLPLLGDVKVSGLTIDNLSLMLKEKLVPFLGKPTVSARIVNFKIAVLGDVMRPGMYSSNSERLTVTEALSLAGDLNITALRDNILLIREVNGERTAFPVDLTSKQVFDSPYFYMRSNDLIVVQPSKQKVAANDTGYRNASLIISALSLVAITISLFTR
jgi:polysaccharide export outer membrane protein